LAQDSDCQIEQQSKAAGKLVFAGSETAMHVPIQKLELWLQHLSQKCQRICIAGADLLLLNWLCRALMQQLSASQLQLA